MITLTWLQVALLVWFGAVLGYGACLVVWGRSKRKHRGG